ncbi:hypothetical protein [Nocardia sp. NPDC006630]
MTAPGATVEGEVRNRVTRLPMTAVDEFGREFDRITYRRPVTR